MSSDKESVPQLTVKSLSEEAQETLRVRNWGNWYVFIPDNEGLQIPWRWTRIQPSSSLDSEQ